MSDEHVARCHQAMAAIGLALEGKSFIGPKCEEMRAAIVEIANHLRDYCKIRSTMATGGSAFFASVGASKLKVIIVSTGAEGYPAKFIPKTERGRRLAALRATIVTNGTPLLNIGQVNEELAQGRRHGYCAG